MICTRFDRRGGPAGAACSGRLVPVIDVHRYHDIAEAGQRVMNPRAGERLWSLGERLGVAPGQQVLDLGCGRGELLCQLARRHGAIGMGIDVNPRLVDEARARAAELGVADRVTIELGDAAAFTGTSFDVVAAIGVSWIGGGLVGTLALLRRAASVGAWFLVGDVYRRDAVAQPAEREPGDLATTLARFEGAGFELLDMELAAEAEWDGYSSRQWLRVQRWLDAHPDDPDAGDVRRWRDASRRAYLTHDRDRLGWGVFVLRSR
jgi:SAM-dependent methyltransferase